VDIPIDEATLPRSQVMDAIGQLISAIDRDRVARHLAERTGCSLKDVFSHYSESFDSRGNHIHAENWLNDVEGVVSYPWMYE
jgi:hypothetical protein